MSKLLSMMKKNDQYMLLNKVGSPTIIDGVVSGFTVTNYLEIQDTINFGTQNFEMKTCFKANSMVNVRLFANNGASATFTGVSITTTGKIRANFYINGSRIYFDSDVLYQTNQNTYIVMYRNGSEIGIRVSTDNTNWITNSQTIQATDSVDSNIAKFLFGVTLLNNYYLDGSIDIPNSYIKIGATKYLFQLVMPLTMVGNPTINNGIVSGFSADDYVRTPLIDNIESASLDLVINYDIPLNNDAMRIFRFGTATSNAYQLRWSNGGNIQYYAKTKRFASDKDISNYKYIRLTTENGLENNVQIFVSNNGNTWEQAILQENALEQSFTNAQIVLGRIIKGNINFKNSYIIINGTKYVFRIYDDNNFDFTDMFALS